MHSTRSAMRSPSIPARHALAGPFGPTLSGWTLAAQGLRRKLDRLARQLLHFNLREQALHLARLDHARAEVLRGLRAARDREAQAVLLGAPGVAAGQVAGEERVARSH